MPPSLYFVLYTLILALGIFSGTSLGRLPSLSPFFWLLPILLLSFALSRFLKHFSSYYLFLAFPLAGLLAFYTGNLVWKRPHAEITTENLVPAGLVPIKIKHGQTSLDRVLYAPPGTRISIFVDGLRKPRMLGFNQDGVLFASLPAAGEILAFPDFDRNGFADQVVVFAEHLDRPHGLDFYQGDLFVAETGRILRLKDNDGDLRADDREVVSDDLPAGGGHWTRTLVVDKKGLFVSIGSDCNACLEEDPRRGTVMRFDRIGGKGQIFSYGLRNSVGLALQPETGELWASDNGRDLLGDDLPPDEINLLISGGDYGWPYCYGQRVADEPLGSDLRCRQTLASTVDLQAHSAPLGIVFAHGLKGPPDLQSSLLVAYHGSWNRTVPTGYKLVAIPFKDHRPSGLPRDLVSGWLQNGKAWGRPVAPMIGPDGAIYLSDDLAGVIYRILIPEKSS